MKKIFVLFLSFSLTYLGFSQVNLDSGLIAYYNFNNNTQNQAASHSHGTKNGAVYTKGRVGADSSAMYFDGINDNVDISIDSFLLKEFTYSLWTKTDGIPPNGDCSTMLGVGGSGGDQGIQYCNNSSSTLPPYLLHGYYAGGSVVHGNKVSRAATGVTPDTSKWYHLVFMRFDKGMKLYVNCILIDSVFDNSYTDYGAKTGVKIGARFDNSTSYKGKIDEVKIYNRAVSHAEVKELGGCNMTSISKPSKAQNLFNVFPNPTDHSIMVTSIGESKMDGIKVYSLSGKLIYSNSFPVQSLRVDLSKQPAGVYIIHVQKDGQVFTQKVNRI
jgi:hypothetical protein